MSIMQKTFVAAVVAATMMLLAVSASADTNVVFDCSSMTRKGQCRRGKAKKLCWWFEGSCVLKSKSDRCTRIQGARSCRRKRRRRSGFCYWDSNEKACKKNIDSSACYLWTCYPSKNKKYGNSCRRAERHCGIVPFCAWDGANRRCTGKVSPLEKQGVSEAPTTSPPSFSPTHVHHYQQPEWASNRYLRFFNAKNKSTHVFEVSNAATFELCKEKCSVEPECNGFYLFQPKDITTKRCFGLRIADSSQKKLSAVSGESYVKVMGTPSPTEEPTPHTPETEGPTK